LANKLMILAKLCLHSGGSIPVKLFCK